MSENWKSRNMISSLEIVLRCVRLSLSMHLKIKHKYNCYKTWNEVERRDCAQFIGLVSFEFSNQN